MATKFEVEKFDGRNIFSLWHINVRALLVQQGLAKALNGVETLSTTKSNEGKDELIEKAPSVILLCLGHEVFHEVAGEDVVAKL